MVQPNWIIIPIAALLPLCLGFIWYGPMLFGKKIATINGESTTQNRSIGKLILIYFLSIFLAYILTIMSVHQSAMYQLFFMDPEMANADSTYNAFLNDFMAKYGDRHRTFGHGVVHGAEAGLMFGLSFFGVTTLLENKPFKIVWVHLGFWMVCCSLMAGLTCAFF